MTDVNEALGARNQQAGLLKDAQDTLSGYQVVRFIPYVRLILPLDGYVFWVQASALSPSAALNTSPLNTSPLNKEATVLPPVPFDCQGSFHYGSDVRQDETTSFTLNRVNWTSQFHVQDFNKVGPNLIYIATVRGVRFAFSSKGQFYEQTKEWHYEGNAIYPFMASQVVDDPRTLITSEVIVSNSLPAWLSLPYYKPAWPVEVPMPSFPMYPSFLSELNAVPPYGTIHIGPDDTEAEQAVPDFGSRLSQHQLSRDHVKVTLYGMNDKTAQDWLAATLGYLRDAGVMGLGSVPNIRDEKSTQQELLTLAMKKSVLFEVSYNQARIRDAARQLITQVVPPPIQIQTIQQL